MGGQICHIKYKKIQISVAGRTEIIKGAQGLLHQHGHLQYKDVDSGDFVDFSDSTDAEDLGPLPKLQAQPGSRTDVEAQALAPLMIDPDGTVCGGSKRFEGRTPGHS